MKQNYDEKEEEAEFYIFGPRECASISARREITMHSYFDEHGELLVFDGPRLICVELRQRLKSGKGRRGAIKNLGAREAKAESRT